MKDTKNEVLNMAADDDAIAGVLDGAELSDDVLEKVSGGCPGQGFSQEINCANR